MPINTLHPLYEAHKPKSQRVRDCYSGTDAVKDAGETYLPRLSGQTDEEYKAYKLRGLFLPVVQPTSTALIGAIMRKEPVIELPQSISYMEDDTNADGRELDLLASHVISELLQAGRVGGLLEHDGERVKILIYQHEHIINWGSDFVVLQQQYLFDDKDKYKPEYKTEYLELALIEGVYTQRVWREDVGGKWGIVDILQPTNRGEPLDYIPFVCANAKELSLNPVDSPLLPIADLNIDHYLLSTDQRHGLHFSALPTMFVFGSLFKEDGTKAQISVGPGRANHLEDTDGRAELLEFTGAGLGSIANAIAEDVVAMAGIGAKMLASNQGGVKAAETARIEASSETATLSTVTNSAESFLQQLLEYAAMWEGAEGDVSVKLNRDFIDSSIDPQMLTALLASYTSGGMSLDTFLDNLQRGEILPKGVDVEMEKERIANGGGDFELDE